MATLDTDGDGGITYQEWTRKILSNAPAPMRIDAGNELRYVGHHLWKAEHDDAEGGSSAADIETKGKEASSSNSSTTTTAAATAAAAAAAAATESLSPSSPWRETEDPASGKSYYYNVDTGVTTWSLPPGAVPQPQSPTRRMTTHARRPTLSDIMKHRAMHRAASASSATSAFPALTPRGGSSGRHLGIGVATTPLGKSSRTRWRHHRSSTSTRIDGGDGSSSKKKEKKKKMEKLVPDSSTSRAAVLPVDAFGKSAAEAGNDPSGDTALLYELDEVENFATADLDGELNAEEQAHLPGVGQAAAETPAGTIAAAAAGTVPADQRGDGNGNGIKRAKRSLDDDGGGESLNAAEQIILNAATSEMDGFDFIPAGSDNASSYSSGDEEKKGRNSRSQSPINMYAQKEWNVLSTGQIVAPTPTSDDIEAKEREVGHHLSKSEKLAMQINAMSGAIQDKEDLEKGIHRDSRRPRAKIEESISQLDMNVKRAVSTFRRMQERKMNMHERVSLQRKLLKLKRLNHFSDCVSDVLLVLLFIVTIYLLTSSFMMSENYLSTTAFAAQSLQGNYKTDGTLESFEGISNVVGVTQWFDFFEGSVCF